MWETKFHTDTKQQVELQEEYKLTQSTLKSGQQMAAQVETQIPHKTNPSKCDKANILGDKSINRNFFHKGLRQDYMQLEISVRIRQKGVK